MALFEDESMGYCETADESVSFLYKSSFRAAQTCLASDVPTAHSITAFPAMLFTGGKEIIKQFPLRALWPYTGVLSRIKGESVCKRGRTTTKIVTLQYAVYIGPTDYSEGTISGVKSLYGTLS